MSNVATGLPTKFYTYVTAGVEPAEPEEGETWYDTQADESKVYDGGSWNVQNIESHGALSGINPDDHHTRYSDGEAAAAAPVQSVNGDVGAVTVEQLAPGILDKAETFSEPGVSLSHADTLVSNESVRLFGQFSSTAEWSTDNTFTSRSGLGVRISVSSPIESVTWSQRFGSTNGSPETVTLHNLDSTPIASAPAGDGEITGLDLPAGDYRLIGSADGNPTINYREAPGEGPYTSDYVDVVSGSNLGSDNSRIFGFDAVGVTTVAQTAGITHIEWAEPPDVYTWDRALFQFVEDGGSVEVYVETNDGSGWQEAAGPIARGDSIGADPDENVRYRVELSRPDTSSNPALEAIYRRRVV